MRAQLELLIKYLQLMMHAEIKYSEEMRIKEHVQMADYANGKSEGIRIAVEELKLLLEGMERKLGKEYEL